MRRLALSRTVEVTASFEAGRLLLFMSLYEKADNANDQNTDLNQIRVCNHCQPPFRKIRGQEAPPDETGELTACRLSVAPQTE